MNNLCVERTMFTFCYEQTEHKMVTQWKKQILQIILHVLKIHLKLYRQHSCVLTWFITGCEVGTTWSTRLACCIDGVHRLATWCVIFLLDFASFLVPDLSSKYQTSTYQKFSSRMSNEWSNLAELVLLFTVQSDIQHCQNKKSKDLSRSIIKSYHTFRLRTNEVWIVFFIMMFLF